MQRKTLVFSKLKLNPKSPLEHNLRVHGKRYNMLQLISACVQYQPTRHRGKKKSALPSMRGVNPPQECIRGASAPQDKNRTEQCALSRSKLSQGRDSQHQTPSSEQNSPEPINKRQKCSTILLRSTLWQSQIQIIEVEDKNQKEYAWNKSQRQHNLSQSCMAVSQGHDRHSSTSLLLFSSQKTQDQDILRQLRHILAQSQQQLHASIKRLFRVTIEMLSRSEPLTAIDQTKQWLSLYLFANSRYYQLRRVKIHRQIEQLINNDKTLQMIYRSSKNQTVQRSLCYYCQQQLDKLVFAMRQLYESNPLSQNIRQMIEVQDCWTNLKIQDHQNQLIQSVFNKTKGQDWLQIPKNMLEFLLKAIDTYPESNQYHHTLFHPQGHNLLRQFAAIRELSKIFQKVGRVPVYGLQFVIGFANQRQKKLQALVDPLELPPGKFITYDIHKRVILITYVYAQVASLLDNQYLQAETLRNIRHLIEVKLCLFQEKLEALRSKDEQLSTDELNLLKQTIAQCQTVGGFLKQAKKQVEDEDLSSQILLLQMIKIIRQRIKKNEEQGQSNP